MKPLLVACALAALVVTLLLSRGERHAHSAALPAQARDIPSRESESAALVGAQPVVFVAPVVAAIEGAAAIAQPDVDVSATDRTTATLTVRVVDEDGAGVVDAWVEVRPTPVELARLGLEPTSDEELEEDSTGADGRVTLEVLAGYTLELRSLCTEATSEGLVLLDALAAGAQAEATIIVLTRPDLHLTGRVVDAVTGEPIAGIQVHLEYASEAGWDEPKRHLPPRSEPVAVTDAAGEFRAQGMSWRRNFALCTGSGWSPRLARLMWTEGDSKTVAPRTTIALLRAARIEGTVTGTSGPTVAIAAVSSFSLIDYDQPRAATIHTLGAQYALEVAVDTGGRFTFESAPARAELSLSLADAATRAVLLQEPGSLSIAPGETQLVTWSLGAGGRLECRVRMADGAPAPDEDLWLLTDGGFIVRETRSFWKPTYRARTDGSGRASFEGLQPGSWLVALAPTSSSRGADAARYAIRATVPSHGAVVPVELTLYEGLYITGTVRAPDGTARATYVTAERDDFHASVQAHECKEGAFRLGPLMPGRYALEASGRSATVAGEAPLTNSRIVHAEAGATDFELWLGDSCDVVLTAADRDSGAHVPAEFGCWRGSESMIWTGDCEPSITFSGRSPGKHRVMARTEDGRIGFTDVELVAGGRTEVTIDVAVGGRVRVEHSGSVGMLTASLEDTFDLVVDASAPPSEVAELVAPSGQYSLRLLVQELHAPTKTLTTLRDERRQVTVTAGVVVELALGP